MAYRNRSVEQCVLNFYHTLPQYLVQFAFDIKKAILSLKNCAILSYQEFAGLNDVSVKWVIDYCESYTGCVKKEIDKNKYIILYNDSWHISEESKLFTLAHELGHIMLGHMIILESYKIYNSSYANSHFESAANYFAATVRCPMPVVAKLRPKSTLAVELIFKLSPKASEIILTDYPKYDRAYNIEWHNDILRLFDFQCDLLKYYTYQLDCIYEAQEVKPLAVAKPKDDDWPDDVPIDKCRPRNIWDEPLLPSSAEITISPNLYERKVLDWI